MLLFWKNIYIYNLKEPICGRLRSMAVQQMSAILLQIFCFLLSGSQEYGLIYAFWFLSFQYSPPRHSLFPKKNNTAYNQKQIFLLLLFVESTYDN